MAESEPPIFMDSLEPKEGGRCPNKWLCCFYHQLTIEKSQQNKVCFRKVKNCHTSWNLCCVAISVCDTFIEHLFWARPYVRQTERSTAFPQGNLSLVGRQTNEQRTKAPQEGSSSCGGSQRQRKHAGGVAESACTLRKGERERRGRAIQSEGSALAKPQTCGRLPCARDPWEVPCVWKWSYRLPGVKW